MFALFFYLCGPDCGQGMRPARVIPFCRTVAVWQRRIFADEVRPAVTLEHGQDIAEDARKLTVNTDARGWPVPRQRQPASIPSGLSAFPPVKAYKASSIPERLKSTGLKLDGPEEYECRLAFPCASLTGGYAAFLWLALHSFHRSR